LGRVIGLSGKNIIDDHKFVPDHDFQHEVELVIFKISDISDIEIYHLWAVVVTFTVGPCQYS
jgi:hypothetical protein